MSLPNLTLQRRTGADCYRLGVWIDDESRTGDSYVCFCSLKGYLDSNRFENKVERVRAKGD